MRVGNKNRSPARQRCKQSLGGPSCRAKRYPCRRKRALFVWMVLRVDEDAFGRMLALGGAFATADQALTSLLYSGEQTDATGMQYLRARFYDPASGRFNRLDPFAGNFSDPLSLHKYLYTHGDPVNGVDPSGEVLLLLPFSAAFFTGALALLYMLYNDHNEQIVLASQPFASKNVNRRGIWYGGTGGLSLTGFFAQADFRSGTLRSHEDATDRIGVRLGSLGVGLGLGAGVGGGLVMVFNAKSVEDVARAQDPGVTANFDVGLPWGSIAAKLLRFGVSGPSLLKLARGTSTVAEATNVVDAVYDVFGIRRTVDPVLLSFQFDAGLQVFIGGQVTDLAVTDFDVF